MQSRVVMAVVLVVSVMVATGVAAASDPWKASETLAPSELAKMLESSQKPAIAYVGPRVLYRAGRIPGATLHGPTSEAAGLAGLKKWARALPRSQALVIYCGCCPMEKCPNVRPAFKALRAMGFTELRILILPTSFEEDWVTKGLPVER